MRVLALSLVTNLAISDSGPRGDDPLIQNSDRRDLIQTLGKGKANHEEVVDAGQTAADDVQDLIQSLTKGLLESDYRI
ncbi:MAG: hypothetical protein Q9164_000235 [Protoblastenia rupestris]